MTPEKTERNLKIVKLYDEGSSICALGWLYHLCPQRVYQIILNTRRKYFCLERR